MKIYVSHSIRGIKGATATHEDMIINCRRAITFTKELRLLFPDIDFYTPAEHEFPPVGYLLRKNYVTVKQVLEIDCEIVSERSMTLAWSPDQFISNGMMREIICASVAGKDVAVVRDIYEAKLIIDAALERKLC
ncbi:hypothetical protein KAR91_43640 [Candidatus Pacearchaeota archaeon]|nr:hypothetical protein [Candidatus Pacearchaeota archaeon]